MKSLEITFLLIVAFMFGDCHTSYCDLNVDSRLLKIIAEQKSTTAEVESAIKKMSGTVSESPQFWNDIANDKGYSIEHRRIAVFQLLRRHVHSGMSVKEAALKLGKTEWLPDQNIKLLELVSSLIPVRTVFGNAIFVIIPFPPEQGGRKGAYLRVGGTMTEAEFIDVLRGKTTLGKNADCRIAEIGFSE